MEGEEEEEGDDTGDGDEFAQASSTRFSELTKSMIRASSASQFTGVESIVVLFPSIPFVFVFYLNLAPNGRRANRQSQSSGVCVWGSVGEFCV